MKTTKAHFITVSVLILLSTFNCSSTKGEKIGVLIMAHGGRENWNEAVVEAAQPLEENYETAFAFGMAHPNSIREGVKELEDEGVTKIIGVPLFMSSHSPIIPQTNYLLGTKDKKPEHYISIAPYKKNKSFLKQIGDHPSLSRYLMDERPKPEKATCLFKAQIDNPDKVEKLQDGYAKFRKDYRASIDKIKPLEISADVTVSEPLNDHPTVADILYERAQEMSENPAEETVLIVGHGPNREKHNKLWVKEMESLAKQIQEKQETKYKQVLSMTLRDDAPDPIHDQAKQHFRSLVRQAGQNGDVIVVPLLLSQGGVEKEVVNRLEGLDYRWTGQTLLPHPKITAFLKQSVADALRVEN